MLIFIFSRNSQSPNLGGNRLFSHMVTSYNHMGGFLQGKCPQWADSGSVLTRLTAATEKGGGDDGSATLGGGSCLDGTLRPESRLAPSRPCLSHAKFGSRIRPKSILGGCSAAPPPARLLPPPGSSYYLWQFTCSGATIGPERA